MKLVKITDDHYVIVNDEEIKVGDYITDNYKVWQWQDNSSLLGMKKVTHSTNAMYKDEYISLQEVKELIGGEVDVEKKAQQASDELILPSKAEETFRNVSEIMNLTYKDLYKQGYNQALEDNKEKKYTEEDMRKIFIHGKQLGLTIAGTIRNGGDKPDEKEWFNESIQSLQPKTQWDVEFDSQGKLKLKKNEI